MGVFIDGSFISNSTMSLVRPNEDFSLFLGIDDSVKLGYSPEKVKKSVVGGSVMRGSKKHLKVVSRDITVTNMSPFTIDCLVAEQLPRSDDGKIKVELRKPDLKKPGELKCNMNEFNHLEMSRKIEPSAKMKIVFEYAIEWPEGSQVEIVTKN